MTHLLLYRTLSLALLALLPLSALAEDDAGGFTADRPGATTGVDVLPKGRLQWETGVAWEHSRLDDEPFTIWTLNSSLLRLGITDFAELRMQADRALLVSDEGTESGFANVLFGTKVRLYSPPDLNGRNKYIPAMSLMANVVVPGSGDSQLMPHKWGAELCLLFQNHLSSRYTLGYEADIAWSPDIWPHFFYGLCLQYQPSRRLSVLLEEYNYNATGQRESWLELSAAWQLSPRVQLDSSTDISLNYPRNYQNIILECRGRLPSRTLPLPGTPSFPTL